VPLQLLSLILVLGFVFAICIVVALAILASPIFAIGIFLIAFAGFLVRRGARRTRPEAGAPRERVPTTEEAAGDPVRDSAAGEAR
jgi:hypothetical protein